MGRVEQVTVSAGYALAGLAAASLVGFAVIILINLHDFFLSAEMPWREGDFQRVMIRSVTGLLISGGLAVLAFKATKAMRRREKEKGNAD